MQLSTTNNGESVYLATCLYMASKQCCDWDTPETSITLGRKQSCVSKACFRVLTCSIFSSFCHCVRHITFRFYISVSGHTYMTFFNTINGVCPIVVLCKPFITMHIKLAFYVIHIHTWPYGIDSWWKRRSPSVKETQETFKTSAS